MKFHSLTMIATCTLAVILSTDLSQASGEWPLPSGSNLELQDKLMKNQDAVVYDPYDEKLNILDLKVILTHSSILPGSWRISAKWGKSKYADEMINAPDKFEFCRVKTHQRGNKGGLYKLSHTARSLTLRLYTKGGPFYDQYTGWQEGWYDITWISDNANKTHRDAHGCV